MRKLEWHGMSRSVEYKAWSAMKDRCLNSNNPKYGHYHGRGIEICDRWVSSFMRFFEDMGEKPSSKHSLDRIDNDGPYSPDNCRWATYSEQNRNQRLRRENKTGISGVWIENDGRFRSVIWHSNKLVYLGLTPDFFEACCLRKSAEHRLWHNSS